MLGDGPRCKVLGDELFSAYWSDASAWNISDIFSDNNKKILKTEKPQQPKNHKKTTTPNVPVDYSYQWKTKYPELSLLRVQ